MIDIVTFAIGYITGLVTLVWMTWPAIKGRHHYYEMGRKDEFDRAMVWAQKVRKVLINIQDSYKKYPGKPFGPDIKGVREILFEFDLAQKTNAALSRKDEFMTLAEFEARMAQEEDKDSKDSDE